VRDTATGRTRHRDRRNGLRRELRRGRKERTAAMTQHSPIILDIARTQLTQADRERVQNPLTGGLILFSRNWQDRAQLTQLCAEIKAIRGDVIVCVDHEGGRVQRFRTGGFTHVAPMRAFGELWMKDAMAATNAATAAGFVLGA